MAVAIDSQEASNAGHRATGSTTLSWSFTNTAGTKLLVGFVLTDSSATVSVSSVTYGGVTMTSGGAGATVTWDTGKSMAAIYYLDSPATGANTVLITPSAVYGAILGGAISFTGAATGFTGATSSGSATGTGTHATAGNITAASGGYLFGVGGWGSGTAATVDSGQTATYKLTGSGNTGGDDICAPVEAATGSAINLGFTWTPADVWGIVAAEVKASGGGAVAIPDLIMAPMVAS